MLAAAALALLLNGCTWGVAYGPDRPYPEPYGWSYWPHNDGYWGYHGVRYYNHRTVWHPNGYYRDRGKNPRDAVPQDVFVAGLKAHQEAAQ